MAGAAGGSSSPLPLGLHSPQLGVLAALGPREAPALRFYGVNCSVPQPAISQKPVTHCGTVQTSRCASCIERRLWSPGRFCCDRHAQPAQTLCTWELCLRRLLGSNLALHRGEKALIDRGDVTASHEP